jgi:hypothetical protein
MREKVSDMHKVNPEAPDVDVPELGDVFFEKARRADEIMPADFLEAVRHKGGRPKSAAPKVAVSTRLA